MFDIAELRQVFGWNPETGQVWWHCHPSDQTRASGMAGCASGDGYVQVKYRGRIMKAHRLIWALHYGSWPTGTVDHKNRVKSDNRISNLRIATQAQNNANSERPNGSSSFKGVSYSKARCRWRARIGINRRQMELGEFASEQDAAAAYDRAAIDLFGDWAVLNFPKPNGDGHV